MGVEILSQKYTNQFNQPSTTSWLLGNVGDILKVTTDVGISINAVFEVTGDTLTLSEPNKIIINGGKNWKERGFYVGLDIIFQYTSIAGGTYSTGTKALTITNIFDNEIEIIPTGGGTWAGWTVDTGLIMPGTASANVSFQDVFVYGVPPTTGGLIEGIKIDYANITNSSVPSGTLASHIDGTITSLVKEGANTMTFGVAESFTHVLDFKSGLSLISSYITDIGSIVLPNGATQYNYRIDLTYMLSPFYDNINNLIDNIAPDEVLGAESLTDTMAISAMPVYNNPNISIKNDPKKTAQLGNTGWFDENFNQLPNPFSATPVEYYNAAGTQVGQLDYANETKIITTLSGLTNLINVKFQYGFIWANINDEGLIIDGVETINGYKENNYPYHENQLISTTENAFPIGTFSGPYTGYSRDNVGGIDTKDVSFTASGTDVIMEVTFVPTAAFTTYMDSLSIDERQYVLWVSIGDPGDTNLSNRVSLKLDFNSMDTYVEPIGAWDGLSINFLNHPQAYTDTPVSCGNDQFVEDDLLAKISFQVDTAVDAATIPVPSAIQFGVLVTNPTTGAVYELDKNSVDLTQYPDPTQYNFDTSREFKLGIGNDKNWWKVDYDATNDSGTLKGVLGWYGYKVRWESWIKRFPLAPNDFYDNSLGQNGQANDWWDYFNTTGWEVNFFVNIVTQLGTYQNLKIMSIKDYDSNNDISTTINFYEEDTSVSPSIKGTQLIGGTDPITGDPLGVILEGENVWLEIIYTWGGGGTPADWASQATVDASVYATNCIGVDGGAGQKEFRQLSSIWLPEASNPMIPLQNETLATVILSTPTSITVSSLIDSSKLTNAERYKISGRIGCK